MEQQLYWRDFQNGDLYKVTGWKPEQDSVRMGVDYHAAAVEPVTNGCIHTVIQRMTDFFFFGEDGKEIYPYRRGNLR